MKPKGILKINGRMMHYVMMDERIVALSLNDTDLIDEIRDGKGLVSFNLKEEENFPATILIHEDKEEIKQVFNKMLDENNTYFKTFDDKLIVLEINLDNK